MGAGWLYIVSIVYTPLNEEALFYWRGGPILLAKFGRRLVEVFYLYPKLSWRLAGFSFYGPCSTWRAGQVILLVWPYYITIINYTMH